MIRLRRLRQNDRIRDMVQETRLTAQELIYPLFIVEGDQIQEPIDSMPGIYRYSIDQLEQPLKAVVDSGVKGVLLFGIPAHKDALGSAAYDACGVVQQAIRRIKALYPTLIVIADICLCEYTDHGHCGLIHEGRILNDETLPYLNQMAITCAAAGADMVAPSDMMDGRVGAMRKALDEAGYVDTIIMAYSTKFASAFYGPFRDACDSTPAFGDRKSYQMDPANLKEAIHESLIDLEEGADLLMVKPALPYLDVLAKITDQVLIPVVAYQVSGEYSMIKAAGEKGWIDEQRVMMESLLAIKRAGARLIITYFALEAAAYLRTK